MRSQSTQFHDHTHDSYGDDNDGDTSVTVKKQRKISGVDFCSARNAERMFKNLIELRHMTSSRQKSMEMLEHDYSTNDNFVGIEKMQCSDDDEDVVGKVSSKYSRPKQQLMVDQVIGPISRARKPRKGYYTKAENLRRNQQFNFQSISDSIHAEKEKDIEYVWLDALKNFAEQNQFLTEFIICLPLVLMTLYIFFVEKGTIFKLKSV